MQLVVQAAQPAPQFLAHLGVQGPEGLVQQEDARFGGERTGERNALALASGQLGRVPVGQPPELDQIEQARNALADLGLGRAGLFWSHPQPEGDVLKDRQVAKEGVVLEHKADLTLADMGGRGVLALQDHAPGIGGLQAGNHPQQRGLAAARGAEQGDEVPGREFE